MIPKNRDKLQRVLMALLSSR